MRADIVVVVAPDRQLAPGVSQAVEQLLVQQLVAQRPIERFNERVLLRLARIDVVPLDPVFAGPLQDRPAGKFGSVIADDASGFAIQAHQRVELACNSHPRDAGVSQQAQVFPAGVIVDRQDAQSAGSAERVGHKVHRPAVVRPQRHGHRRPAAASALAAPSATHRQPLLPVQPVELLVVHDVPLAFEHDADAPVAEPAAYGGDLAHLLADLGMVWRTFSPRPVAGMASSDFSQQVLQDRIVQHAFGQEPLELAILILKLAQPPGLRYL